MAGTLPLEVMIDDQVCESESRYSWAAGVHVLTISTVVPRPSTALQLISTYIGEARVGTVVTHLALGPVGRQPSLQTDCPVGELDPGELPRACAYDHARMLIDTLQVAGFNAAVRVDELTFAELERVR